MLRDLTIQNYRAFKDFSIDGLARVNLIVGDNNSGKTSFLEAVYLLVNEGSVAALIEVLDARDEFGIEVNPSTMQSTFQYQVSHIFYGHAPETGEAIEIASQQDFVRSATMRVRKRGETVFSEPELELMATYNSSKPDIYSGGAIPPLPLHPGNVWLSSHRYTPPVEGRHPHRLVTVSLSDVEQLSNLWDQIIRDPEKEELVASALKILEPKVVDIRFTHQRTAAGVLIKLADQPRRVALSSMGDGMRRLLNLSATAVMSEGGTLLVDEIDTGLYHGAQTRMWLSLIGIAQRYDVQIFATTHSWDCVASFQEALADSTEPDEGRLFRLQVRGDKIVPVDYSSNELAVAVRQAIEVR